MDVKTTTEDAENRNRLEYLEGFVARLEKRVEALEALMAEWNWTAAELRVAHEAVEEYRENRR